MRSADSAARRPRVVYLSASAVLAAVAGVLWLVAALSDMTTVVSRPSWWISVVLFAAFAAGELFPLRFDMRTERLMVSLSELPLVLGVLLLPPWLVGVAYGAAALVAFLIRRGALHVVLLNLALVALETAVTFAVVSWWGPWPSGVVDLETVQPRLVPAALGVLLGACASAIAVALIRRGLGIVESSVQVVFRSVLIAAVIVGLTFAGLVVWLALPHGPVLCFALLISAALLYRGYLGSLHQRASLSDLYAFGASVAAAGRDPEAWQSLVQRVREQLGVKVAAICLLEGDEVVVLAAERNGPLQLTGPPEGHQRWAEALVDGAFVAPMDRASSPEISAAIGGRGRAHMMAAALRSRGQDRGYVAVWDTRSRWRGFTNDDLALLKTLGGHLATAVENERLVRNLQHAAFHDSVTGLLNRSGLEARGDAMVARGERLTVLLLELAVLGDVTSALGHDNGMQLLMTVTKRLREVAGPDMVLGRIGADRFVALIPGQSEAEHLAFAEQMYAAASVPVVVDSVEIEPNVVVTLASGGGADPSAGHPQPEAPESHALLLQHALLTLASARAKDERIAVYRPAIGEVYQRRFQLVSQFRHAVDAGQVSVHYQPKLSLMEKELIGVEALVRWTHPEFGPVSPAELIEAIEPTSAIDVLFGFVLNQSLAQIADWSARGMRIAVAVNLSVRNLLAPNLVQTVSASLARHGVPSELLTLEVTESSVMNQPERSLPVLQELHSMGIRLSVDDFGTGYSSLAYLRRLPIDELKIDRSFVQGMVTDLGDLAIVRAIIDLGHSLGMRVIAEGVEEEAGRDALRSMRCDAMQGFLLSRPLPIDRFETWLLSRTMPPVEDLAGKPTLLRLRV